MNKKQRIIAWIIGILIILRALFPLMTANKGLMYEIKGYRFGQVVLILIIGIFLIYVARDKNKPKEKPKDNLKEKPKVLPWRKRR